MKMLINITTPREITYYQIIFRTMKYFHLKRFTNIIEDKAKRYYIFLKRKNIQIKIVNYKNETTEEINNYLEYAFKNSYLGIQESYFNIFKLKKVRLFKM